MPGLSRFVSRSRWAGLLAVGCMLPVRLAGQVTVPPKVTVERVAEGLNLYHGKGQCDACHGALGVGTDEGPSLLTGAWKLGPGDYPWLVHITRHAGWGSVSRGGDPAPMRGPTVLNPDEIDAVAAYVWNISRGRTAGVPRS